ncbi:MAG: hypothetical protein A2W93_06300 [Bacteroidetes bacterium GWF2_43_63]|nr:MAG: hypothetical protein A2W94_08235 [Bacteroidetes bacterium GWE2_42_42]OFY53231.1 MAG: hypothetical protein A2W93_06300 [Bacteroidetes bacterium GWF2_43_63]HBG71777.1 hypothetical protein [Bacteroidales bacterium]HCB61558.1 hypothetical protein [Bacteroidales bacterium]HCY22770.1 hypothetical protein [Bacteroidales bacterium]
MKITGAISFYVREMHKQFTLVCILMALCFSSGAATYTSCATMIWPGVVGNWNTGTGCNALFPTGSTSHSMLISAGHVVTYNLTTLNTSGSLTVNGTWKCSTNGTVGALVINSGGVFTITGGTFTCSSITINSGGTLNVNGGTISLTNTSGNSLVVNGTLNLGAAGIGGGQINNKSNIIVSTTGVVNINHSSAKLNYTGTGSNTTNPMDGTIECNGILTSSNYYNFDFGFIMVTSGTSTGLIRSQTAYIPSNNTWSAANNFFGFNSTYGGTVEYYGTSDISFGLYSQRTYHTLKISNTNALCVLLYSTYCYSTSILNLANTSSFINIGSAKLFIRGTIKYTGNSYIKTSSSSNLAVHGYIGASTICADNTAGVVSTVSSENTSVNIMQPLLRFSPAGGSTGFLNSLDLYREDVVTINDNVNVSGTLSLRRGILKTNSYILYLSNTTPSSLTYNTVGFSSTVGWVSGNLKRACSSGLYYEFPVGRTDVTTFASDYPKYRHFQIQLLSVAASPCNIKVNFNTVFNPDVCSGTLINAWDDGINYNQLHPEGWWSVIPDAGITSTTYNARGYIYGFTGAPVPVNNKYGLLKRIDGSSLCSDWTNGNGTLNTAGTSGRIHEYSSTLEIGYAQRNGLTSFSEFAIGITNGPLPVEIIELAALNKNNKITLSWTTATETNNDYFTIEKSINAEDWVSIETVDGAGNSNELVNYEFEDVEPMSGTSYYRLKQTDFDGKFEYFGPVTVNCNEGANGIIAYPNPAQENVLVVGSQDVPANIYLCDLTGRIIAAYSCNHLSEPFSIDLQNILPGIYLIRVDAQNSPEYFRVVKE